MGNDAAVAAAANPTMSAPAEAIAVLRIGTLSLLYSRLSIGGSFVAILSMAWRARVREIPMQRPGSIERRDFPDAHRGRAADTEPMFQTRERQPDAHRISAMFDRELASFE